MTITIAPFEVDAKLNGKAAVTNYEKEKTESKDRPITYWGIYLDDKYISHTSSVEQAESTKSWMEKWLKDIKDN